MFYSHFCAHGRLNGPSDEIPFRYANADIRTQVVAIYDPTRNHLEQGGAPFILLQSIQLMVVCN